jgi:hypothetical protein
MLFLAGPPIPAAAEFHSDLPGVCKGLCTPQHQVIDANKPWRGGQQK